MFLTPKRLLGHSALYTLAAFLNRGLVFILIPLYSRFLTIEEFGLIALLESISSVAKIIFTVGLQGAAFRFYFLYDGENRRSFYSTIWIFVAVFSGLLTVTCFFGGTQFFTLFSDQSMFPIAFKIVLVTTFLRSGFEVIPLQLFRASEEVNRYFLFSFLSIFATVGAQVFFILSGRGLVGILYGNLLSAFCMAVLYSITFLKRNGLSFVYSHLVTALSFSVPLVPHFLGTWLLSLSDRWILGRYVSLSQIGVYSMADQFRQGYNLLAWGANTALMPEFGKVNRFSNQKKRLSTLVTYYVFLICFAGILIVSFSRDVLRVIAGSRYSEASLYIPLFIAASFLYALESIPMNTVSQIAGKTSKISLVTLVAGGLTVGLNFLFIPSYGLMAAAGITIVGFLFQLCLIHYFASRVYELQYEKKRLLLLLVTGLLFSSVGFLASSTIPGLFFKALLVLSFPIAIYFLGFYTAEEERAVRNTFGKLRRSLPLAKKLI
jgi:O-antigen/teichoic acid export membrane protein